jgi:uncharacterized protein (UPF0179 family)
MLTTEQYRAKLEIVLKEIKSLFDIAEIRGSEDSCFIYAEKQRRVVEVYKTDHTVIVEFWENNELIRENEVYSYDKAAEVITDWMQSKV